MALLEALKPFVCECRRGIVESAADLTNLVLMESAQTPISSDNLVHEEFFGVYLPVENSPRLHQQLLELGARFHPLATGNQQFFGEKTMLERIAAAVGFAAHSFRSS